MKKAIVIYNPNSGKKKNTLDLLNKCRPIFTDNGYECEFVQTKYKGHAKDLLTLLMPVDLVISVGGDGTFNEIVSGNLKRKEPLVLSHIPIGTANDLRDLFGLGTDISKNLELILTGKDKYIDLCLINEQPFVYVAGFGKFMNISYDTPRNKKSKFGYLAYIVAGVKDFFKPLYLYDIDYEIDGKTYSGKYTLGIISNANRIAGVKNFYKDVKLDDELFEVLLCKTHRKDKFLKSLIDIGLNDVTKAKGFNFYRTNNIKITFKNKLRYPWTLDGEKFNENGNTYNVKVKSMKFRLSEGAVKKNCTK